MDLEKDLKTIARQEDCFRLKHFNADTAWVLGVRLKEMAEARGVAITIEVRLAKETVFFFAMQGTSPSNADWARRKRNTVELLHHSSYRVGLDHALNGGTLESKMGLPMRDYADHGGSFPIAVEGSGCIGAVTVSGLPQREDHAMAVEALAGLCGVSLDGLRLD
ncbi:heme-degrading domain-containing protein [Rhizobacter sp. SG703]|uniref:heme-degrading domain-containing protein n=1 Tax=Rhizobacter sp. SG703 TaxID=2587140 RepID=UPI001445B71C|nr:heme-degrading domain-containing protein [Rhizobacter sp. SG703]